MADVLVLSIAVGGYRKLFDSCIRTQRAYSHRCGYEYLLVECAPRALLPTEAAWLKIGMVRAALLNGYTWVAFIDADCDVRRSTPPFAAHLAPYPDDKAIFMAPGISGRINSGVIFVRQCAAAVALFEQVEAFADVEIPVPQDRAPYENGHVIHFAKANPAVALLEHRLWNNNSRIDAASHIQHYSGGPLREWYMDNRAPGAFMRRVSNTFKRIVRKGSKLLAAANGGTLTGEGGAPSANETSVLISESMKELMPFFADTYPVFRVSDNAAVTV